MVKFAGADALRAHMSGLSRNLEDEVAAITTEAMSDGKELMKRHIATRATPKVRQYEGRDGRIVTSVMINSVSGDPAVKENGKVTGKFGWKPSEALNYFWYQEAGFTHKTAGDVEPMHALFDAFVSIREEWVHKLEKLK